MYRERSVHRNASFKSETRESRRRNSRRGNHRRGDRVAKVPKREASGLRLKSGHEEDADASITPRHANMNRTLTRAWDPR